MRNQYFCCLMTWLWQVLTRFFFFLFFLYTFFILKWKTCSLRDYYKVCCMNAIKMPIYHNIIHNSRNHETGVPIYFSSSIHIIDIIMQYMYKLGVRLFLSPFLLMLYEDIKCSSLTI